MTHTVVSENSTAPTALTLERLEHLDSIREEWSALADRCDNLFWTWEWQSLWWKHFGRGRRLVATAVRNGEGRLVGVLPMYVAKSAPLRIIRFIGHGHGDSLGPICHPSDSESVAETVRRALGGHRFDLFLGDHVAPDGRWGADLGAKVLRRTGYPSIRFNGASWDDYLGSLGSASRKQVRRRERQLPEEHQVHLRLCDDPSRLRDDLDILYRLHRARFGVHGDCCFCGASEAFHREFAERALERGWLRFRILELNGQPAAALYHFRFRGIEFGYQSGRDPAWNHASVGTFLEVRAIRQALEDGATEYRFLVGPEDYKYRFANEDSGLVTVLAAGSAVGRIALAAANALGRQPVIASLGKRLAG